MLLDPSFVHVGDIVILTGSQLYGGEHAPQIYGYGGSGFRVYRHELSEPNEFYNLFINNKDFQKFYEIEEKIFLSNGSNELAALILRKYK